jgi:flagellar export protein FliJ
MKRYVSTLAPVLRVRQAQEGLARANLQKANAATATARAIEGQAWSHYKEVSSSPCGPSFQVHHQLAGFAAEAVADAAREVETRKAEAAEATASYLDAAKAVSAVERLEERRREEHALGVLREEAALVDELVTARYTRGAQSKRSWSRRNKDRHHELH